MNWDDLRLFLAVSREPRLEQAAKRLELDATTLSRRLKRLEQETGTVLFERSRRGHHLSAIGEAFLPIAETIETAILSLEGETRFNRSDLSGTIRLGAPEGLGTTLIAPLLAGFAKRYPQIRIELIALSGFVSVPKREADMSVLLTRPTKGPVKVRKIADYGLHLYATQRYLNDRPQPCARADLKKHRLIGYVKDLIYSPELRYLDQFGTDLEPTLLSSSIVAQRAMAEAHAGLAVLPDFMAQERPHLKPVLADEFSFRRTFWLTIHEDVADFARVRALADHLIDGIRKAAAKSARELLEKTDK